MVKNNFTIENKSDINLTLSYLDYDSIEALFDNPYYDIALNDNKYNLLLKRYKRTNKFKYLELLNGILINYSIKIPLFKLNSYYLKNDKLNTFNYEELNYEEL